MSAMPLLEVADLAAGYHEGWVLHDVSVTVGAGEVVCVLGPNGAGKTTLLRAISGMLPRISGSVTFDGTRLRKMRPHRRARAGIVHVPEGRRTVIASLTVAENIRLAGGALGDVEGIFPVLSERRNQRAGTLSGGQQQMLAIALGLMLNPRVLLVDEPSAGLAPSLVEEVFDHLRGLRVTGTAMLLTEQRVDLALALADRGYVMETGRVVAAGPASALRSDPRLSESYLGAAKPT